MAARQRAAAPVSRRAKTSSPSRAATTFYGALSVQTTSHGHKTDTSERARRAFVRSKRDRPNLAGVEAPGRRVAARRTPLLRDVRRRRLRRARVQTGAGRDRARAGNQDGEQRRRHCARPGRLRSRPGDGPEGQKIGLLSSYLFALNVLDLPLVEARTVATTVLVTVGLYLIVALEAAGRRRSTAVGRCAKASPASACSRSRSRSPASSSRSPRRAAGVRDRRRRPGRRGLPASGRRLSYELFDPVKDEEVMHRRGSRFERRSEVRRSTDDSARSASEHGRAPSTERQ